MANTLLIVLLPVLIALLVIGILFAAGRKAKAELKRRYPPLGKLIDVGSTCNGEYRLHINAQGDRAVPSLPTVILEAGRGDTSLTWAAVQPEVAKFARVCSYDRAGLLWSDRSVNHSRSASSVVDDLHNLLRNGGERPPFVLVGHSIGGLFVRAYAKKYPEDVAGVVLVDSTHGDEWLMAQKWELGFLWFLDNVFLVGMCRMAQMLNLLSIMAIMSHGCKAQLPLIPAPEHVRAMYSGVVFRDNKHIGTCIDEIKVTPTQVAESREAVKAPIFRFS